MCPKWIQLGMLAVVLSVNADAGAQDRAPLPTHVSAQNGAPVLDNTSVRSTASSSSTAPPTPYLPAQTGAVIIPPPALRYAGKTVLTPDVPLFGRLNLQAGTLQGARAEQPPSSAAGAQ